MTASRSWLSVSGVVINEYASVYVSVLHVPLILRTLAYSSNQANVRDLF